MAQLLSIVNSIHRLKTIDTFALINVFLSYGTETSRENIQSVE